MNKNMTESQQYELALKEIDSRLEKFISVLPWIILISGILSVIC